MPKFLNTIDADTNPIINVADPTNPADAATKSYVDSVASGLDIKDSVRAATTANIADLSTGAPDTVDGVSLSAGDRVLVKDQTAPSENGIYVADTVGTGSDGAWSRATDFDEDAEVTAGAFTFVSEGTNHGDEGWVVTSDDPIVVDTDAINWAKFSTQGQLTFRDGLTKSGSTVDVNPGNGLAINGGASSGGAVEINLDGTANGGNGSGLALAASGLSANVDGSTIVVNGSGQLEAADAFSDHKYAADIGDGASKTLNVNHSLGTTDVQVVLYDNSNGEQVFADVDVLDANNVEVRIGNGPAPASNGIRVIVIG